MADSFNDLPPIYATVMRRARKKARKGNRVDRYVRTLKRHVNRLPAVKRLKGSRVGKLVGRHVRFEGARATSVAMGAPIGTLYVDVPLPKAIDRMRRAWVNTSGSGAPGGSFESKAKGAIVRTRGAATRAAKVIRRFRKGSAAGRDLGGQILKKYARLRRLRKVASRVL